MKNHNIKILQVLCLVLLLSLSLTSISFAHSGRTDSQGGHHDYKNKSGLGSYHYHCGGHPAHLHTNGICPYSSSNFSHSSSASSQLNDYIIIDDFPTIINANESTSILFTMYSYYDDFSYTITSSDPSIVKIDKDDTIIGVSEGTADIIIRTSHTEKVIPITVKEVLAEYLNMYIYSHELQVGKTATIETRIDPGNTTNRNIYFSSSDNNIATVTSKGVIKGISSGKVTITAKTSNNIVEKLDINVYEVFPREIECEDNINLIVGDLYDFPVKILPLNSNNQEYSITCDKQGIVECNTTSQLKAIKEGNATLHIETWNGIKKDIPIQVNIIPVKNVNIQDSTEYIYSNIISKSSEIKLLPEVFPENATYKDLTWESSNDKIVSIKDNDFIVNGTGKVTLSCTAHNNISKDIKIVIIDKNLIYMFSIVLVGSGTGIGIVCVKRKGDNIKPKKEWKYLL